MSPSSAVLHERPPLKRGRPTRGATLLPLPSDVGDLEVVTEDRVSWADLVDCCVVLRLLRAHSTREMVEPVWA